MEIILFGILVMWKFNSQFKKIMYLIIIRKRINYSRVKIKTLQINLNQLEFKDVLLNVLLLYKILKKGGTLL